MDYQVENLLTTVERFVEHNLRDRLSNQMYFHNLNHTLLVVEGVKLIGKTEGLSEDELFILVLAAFLHDVGYTEQYRGHEEESARIASELLGTNGLAVEKIELVKKCIISTKFPQHPAGKLEEVICDADFLHFSLPDYQDYASRLKMEWETNLNLFYSDIEWDKLNLNMLSAHLYFTDYGKNTLQQQKAFNIMKLKSRLYN
ncbi:HD domain-containing protein [Pedobacter frigidisoli]|uniref:HD domain-containing protein n=1 Tax=Pedobacter frigidisoli TaxID=2530455 RepID=UPI00292D983E|nr:HD domain-containing protein [Pedobacter frigidisoli]